MDFEEYRRVVEPMIRDAVPVWQRYQQKRSDVDDAFEAYRRARDDASWERVSQAQRLAWKAAEEWQRQGRAIFAIEPAMHRHLSDIGPIYGIDIRSWEISARMAVFFLKENSEERYRYRCGAPSIFDDPDDKPADEHTAR